MTISSTQVRKSFTGDGSTTAFTYNYRFLANADLKVYQEGVLKTLTTHYTVTGAGDPSGGTVTFVTAPAVDDEIVVVNDPSNTQTLDLVDNDDFPAESLEAALDRLTIQVQRCRDLLARTIVLPDTDVSGASVQLPAAVSSNLIGWNLAGTALQNVDPDNLGSLTIGVGGISMAQLADGILAASTAGRLKMADEYVTADKLASTLNLSGKTLTLPAANTPAFTKSYTSADQTITKNGSLTLAHSLGAAPKLVTLRLKCVTGELGYSADEVVDVAINGPKGASAWSDATNVYVRFSDNIGVFEIVNRTTGNNTAITAANWSLVVRAWA